MMTIVGILLGLVLLWVLVEALVNLVIPLGFLMILFKGDKTNRNDRW